MSGRAMGGLAPEANFDGLVGPTHNFAGMSTGNVASETHRGEVSNPRAAVLQGLDKMEALLGLGLVQGFLPPLARPATHLLRRIGYTGSDAEVLERAWRDDPAVVVAFSNASAMWTANAATVSPAAHCGDGRVHFTAANLAEKLHRAIEAEDTARHLRVVFPEGEHFAHHAPLPTHPAFGDEGAANHMLLRPRGGGPGLEIFVHGRRGVGQEGATPQRFPARQTLAASRAVARAHGLGEGRVVFVQQRPEAIDAGVFHNDVIAVANDEVLLYHEDAFVEEEGVLEACRRALEGVFVPIRISRGRMSVEDAVSTYLFNSQLLTVPGEGMVLVTPVECREHPVVSGVLEELVAGDGPISRILSFDVRESMQNGGGPACLRLRVQLGAAAQAAVHPGFLLDAERIGRLREWACRHYRDRLVPGDLGDPVLLSEVRTALDELTVLIGCGSIYPFQLG